MDKYIKMPLNLINKEEDYKKRLLFLSTEISSDVLFAVSLL